MEKRNRWGKTKKLPGAEIILKVDKVPVVRNPSEKDVFWWCLEGIRPHLPFMSTDAIKLGV